MPTSCHTVAGGVWSLALQWPGSLWVERTDLPGGYKDLVLGQLNNLSVPQFFSSVKWGCELQCLLWVAVIFVGAKN